MSEWLRIDELLNVCGLASKAGNGLRKDRTIQAQCCCCNLNLKLGKILARSGNEKIFIGPLGAHYKFKKINSWKQKEREVSLSDSKL